MIPIASQCQDVMNPYNDNDYSGKSITYIPYSHNNFLWNSAYANGAFNTFTGEYEISLRQHFWHTHFGTYRKTFTIETLSFPFVPECELDIINCSSQIGNTRNLVITPWNYNIINKAWEKQLNNGQTAAVYNWMHDGKFDNQGMSFIEGNLSWHASERHVSLASIGFTNTNGLTWDSRLIMPNTIHRITINIHCDGSTGNNGIISSFSFIQDNTRGRMRFYPFIGTNQSSSAFQHDVVFAPELLFDKSGVSYGYNQVDNTYMFPGSGTLNFYEYNQINRDCNVFIQYPSHNSNFFWEQPDFYSFLFPPPYSVTSTFLRNGLAQWFAGYQSDFSNNLELMPGIEHVYDINQNLDLRIISTNNFEIYNPYVTSITASNLIFPDRYRFKTIRGVFPLKSEVDADNIYSNGGPFNELGEVPVRTDLRHLGLSYPKNPTIPAHSVYASIYKMQSGSKVDVKDCVGLFDLTFEVNQGASLVLNTYPNIWGKEQFGDNTLGRYKVLTRKGAVLRNYKTIQYVQNGEITQNYPLQYIAKNEIIAGYNVDIEDADAVVGNYETKPGADVTFRAGQSITLKPGFHAQSGSNFLATIGVTSIPPQCPQQIANPVNTRMGNIAFEPQVLKTDNFKLYPNPASGSFSLEYQIDEPAIISIYNSIGNLISQENLSSENQKYEANTGNLKPGIYQYRISGRSGKQLHNGKLVVM